MSRTIAAVLLGLCLALAACGGDDDDDSGSSNGAGGGDSAEARGQDADAQANARNATSQVESCYAGEQDYTRCTPEGELGSGTGLEFGSEGGQVEIEAPTQSSFVIIAHSESGNEFRIEKADDGSTTRTCTEAGTGACAEGGDWDEVSVGGSESAEEQGSSDSAEAKGQDADVKSDTRVAATELEVCFADNQDYTKCKPGGALQPEGVEFGSDAGQVEIAETTATSYTLVGRSESGNEFIYEKPDSGSTERRCTEPGTGDCPVHGNW